MLSTLPTITHTVVHQGSDLAGSLTSAVWSGAVAGPIGPHAPNGKGLPGSGAIDTIISWTMYGALVACVLAVVIAGGMVAIGNTSSRPHVAERGKVTLIWALVGAVVIGVSIPLVNKAFGLG